MNCYCTLVQLKADLGITGTSDDARLLAVINASSRAIDRFCGRFFYVWEGIKYFDGACPLFIDDLLSIDTNGFQTDEDGDLDYDNILAETDYLLYRLGDKDFPRTLIRLHPNSAYGGFGGSIKKSVKITGKWGYGDGISATPYRASVITIVADDATETELDVSAEGTIEAEHTILVESEQIYVSAASSDGTKKITVRRAVNGTTGNAHATKIASIYQYPDDIVQACLMIAGRLFNIKGKALKSERLGDYSYTIADSEFNSAELGLLKPFRKLRI